MTARSRAALKLLFEDEDKPAAAAYGDFIDSGVNLVDTTAQAFGSDLKAPKIIAINVCASSLHVGRLIVGSLSNVTTVSANVVITSAIQHKGPYGRCQGTFGDVTYGGSLSPIKVSAVTIANVSSLLGFTHTSPNRLRRVGNTIIAMVKYNFTGFTVGGTGGTITEAFIAKNGVVQKSSRASGLLNNTQTRGLGGTAVLSLASGDFVEVWTATSATAIAITRRALSLAVHPISWTF